MSRFCTCQEDLPEEKAPISFGDNLRLALRIVGNRKWLSFPWLIAERAAVGFCDLLLAGAMYLLFLLLQGGSPTHHRWWPTTTLSAAIITVTLVVLRALMDLATTRTVTRHVQNIYTDILLRLTDGYNGMQWVRFAQRNRSELLNHAMYTAREAANFYHLGIEIVAAAAVVIAMTIALICKSPSAACGLSVAMALFYGVHRFLIRKKLQRSASERDQSLQILQKEVAEMLASGKEIRSSSVESFFHNRIFGRARSVAANQLRVAFLPQVARILAEQGVVLLFLCIVIAVQLHHGDARRMLSLLVFYFVLSRRLLPLISQVALMAGQMESSFKNVQVIAHELNDCILYRTASPKVQIPDGDAALELDQVSFAFPGGQPVLRNATFRLRRGETVLLRGVSGSGKSSLLNLIAGILQPAAGMVRVDRGRIAYVPQDIALLDDSIRNNLLFGLAAKSDAELMNALAVASLEEFVAAQPLGLETGIGDNGILLSGGQRQRLGIARAVLRRASLLLLDEATSALDEETESRVLENLSASGVAVLLVTHRVHRHGSAQRAMRLQEGCLIEEAIHELSVPCGRLEPAGLPC